jgi:TolB-like protein/Flp pilus assembly protein TadD
MFSKARARTLISELQRRRVFRVVVAYAAIAFGTVSVASDFLPALGLPGWTVTVVAWSCVLGFPIAIVLAWLYDITPGGLRRDDAPDAEHAADGPNVLSSGRAAGFVGVGMIVALVSVGALSSFNALPLPGSRSVAPSIAVLPFEDLSGDPSNDYFSAGIHEEILTQLYKLGGMTVIAPTSVVQYRGTTLPLREIARELGVTTLLKASVRRAGNRIRIDARLIDAGTGQLLWADHYDSELSNVLALQADIAQRIAEALHMRLSPVAQEQLAATRARTVDPAMYERYLQGLFHSGQGRPSEAIAAFERALEIDPDYAPAWAGIARSNYALGFFGALPPAEAFGALRRAATRAIELDPDLADAHATLALHRLHYDMAWQEADVLFREALRLSPNHAQVRHDYAHYLLAAGRIPESVDESMHATQLDPGNMMLMACAGWHGFTDHEYDNAVEQARRALMMMPNALWPEIILGWAYQQKGMHGPALASLRSAASHSTGSAFALASLAQGLAAAGERTPARRMLAELFDMAREQYVSAYDIAAIYAGLGELDDAFTWLRRAYAERSPMLVNVGWDPRFDPLRKDARFDAFVAEISLPDRPPPRPSTTVPRQPRGM